jgi:hypothetical protein
LLPTSTTLAPLDRDIIHSIFGFREISIPQHGCQEADIRVAFSKIEGGPTLGRPENLTALLRRAVWQHPIRNRRIVQLANALAYETCGFFHDQHPGLAARWENLPPERIAILVDNLEHAEVLARLLPDWVVINEPHHPDGIGRKLILVAGSGPGIGSFDVVVRADAGVGLSALRHGLDFPGKVNEGTVLIDFDDRHHPELRQRSRWRRDAYSRAGWSPSPGDDAAQQLDQFLASRPKGVGR